MPTKIQSEIKMKRKANPPGTPFNFDFIADWLFPDLWEKDVPMRFRGAAFIFVYSLSVFFYFSIIILPIAVFLSRPIDGALKIVIYFGIPIGIVCGMAAWWDFYRKSE